MDGLEGNMFTCADSDESLLDDDLCEDDGIIMRDNKNVNMI